MYEDGYSLGDCFLGLVVVAAILVGMAAGMTILGPPEMTQVECEETTSTD